MTAPPNPYQPAERPGAQYSRGGDGQPVDRPGPGQGCAPGWSQSGPTQPGCAQPAPAQPGQTQPGQTQPGPAPGDRVPASPAMSVGDGLSWAWSRLRANPLVLLVGVLAWTVLTGVWTRWEVTFSGQTYGLGPELGLGGSLLTFATGLLSSIALANVTLRTAAGQPVTWRDLVSLPNAGAGLLAGLLSALAVFVGGVLTFFLLGAGAVVLAYLLYFSVYVTTDTGVRGTEGVTTSMSILVGGVRQLVPFALAGLGLLALGLVTVVGWVVTVPLVHLMTAYAYVRAQGRDVAR